MKRNAIKKAYLLLLHKSLGIFFFFFIGLPYYILKYVEKFTLYLVSIRDKL